MEEQDSAGQAAQMMDQVLDHTKETVGKVVDQTKQVVGQVVDQTKQTTGGVADQVVDTIMAKARNQAITLLAAQKDDVAAILQAAAPALRQMGSQLRAQDRESAAQPAEQAAEHLARLSLYLRDREVSEITAEVERLASRLPGAVLAGSIAVGLLGGRILEGITPSDQDVPEA